MHVTRVTILAALAASGCTDPSASALPKATFIPSTSAAALPAATPPSPETIQLARDALKAATALVKSCFLRENYNFASFASCNWTAKEADPLRAATDAFIKSAGVPKQGPGDAFANELTLFADFVDLTRDLPKNETLRQYQRLAIRWNDWRPEERVVVDPRVPYEMRSPDGGLADGGVLQWERCGGEPCIVTDRKRQREVK